MKGVTFLPNESGAWMIEFFQDGSWSQRFIIGWQVYRNEHWDYDVKAAVSPICCDVHSDTYCIVDMAGYFFTEDRRFTDKDKAIAYGVEKAQRKSKVETF